MIYNVVHVLATLLIVQFVQINLFFPKMKIQISVVMMVKILMMEKILMVMEKMFMFVKMKLVKMNN